MSSPSNPSNAAIAAITAAAKRYGIDPKAMIAVAHSESGLRPDAIGDGGHAFGLFQFNNAGGIITGQANPQRYLDPKFNAMEAARHISTIPGIKGAKGDKAINLIVRSFERPANPDAEVQRSTQYYKGISPETISRAQSYQGVINSTSSKGSVTAPNASSGGGQGLSTSQPFDSSQSLLGYLLNAANPASGNTTDQLLNVLNTPQLGAQQAQAKGQTVVPSSTAPATTAPTLIKGAGAVTTIKNPKIIGTPHQGTHNLGNWESDNAIDIAMPKGTPLYATSDGTIGDQFGSLGSSGRFQGIRLHLKTKGDELYYAHLSKTAPGIKPGAKVKKGQLLGYSGVANGVAHLHLGAKSGNPEQYK